MLKQKQLIPVLRLSRPVVALFCLVLVGATLVAQVFTQPEHAQAATNETINFQARLLTASGSVVADGYYNVEFKLYTTDIGGAAFWAETRQTSNRVRVVNGYLTVNLGSVTAFPPNVAWDQELWMSMNIGGITETPDWDGEMDPRLKLTSVPFAKRASELAGGSGANRTVLDVGTPSGDNLLQLPAESGILCVRNSSQCGFMVTASGVQLQAASPGVQQTGHFNVSGIGIVGTALQTPIVDNAGALSLGTTNATSVSLGHSSINTTITGSNVYLTGNTSVTSGNTFSVQSGWASITGLNTANPNPTLTINSHSSGASPLVVQSGGTTVFTVANGGAATFKNSIDSINALSVQNASGVALLNVDSSNGRVGVGGTATYSKFEVIGGDAAVYNNGNSPRLVLGDSTATGENGFLQWDSTNNYFRIETMGTNGLKVKDNYVAIGGIFPDQPLIVGNGSTVLFRVNTTGDVLAKTSTNSTTAFQVQNASGTSLLTVDTSTPQVNLNTTTTIQGSSAGSLSALTINTGAASNKGLVINGASLQSANLIDVQDASANTLFKVDADGDATIARTLDIQYQSGVTNQLSIQGPSGTFVTVNTNQNKFFIGGDDSQCSGRFCVYQNTTGTGGSSYTNSYNASLLNVSTASIAINQDIILTDTSAIGTSNTLRGIRINSTSSTNTSAAIYSLQIQLPTTTSGSVFGGNAIQVQNGSTNIFRVTNVGQTLIQTTNSTNTAFVVQNASGSALLTVDTTGNNQVILGKASTVNGKLAFQNATNANTVTFLSGATSTSYSLTLPVALGVAGSCLKDSNGSGVLSFDTCATSQTAYDAGNQIVSSDNRNILFVLADTATDANFRVDLQCDVSCGTNGRFQVEDDGTTVFSIRPGADNGAAYFQNSGDTTDAFNIQNAAGTALVRVDTTNGLVVIGDDPALAGASAKLLIGDDCGNNFDCVSIFEGPYIGETVFDDSDTMQIQGAGGIRFSTSYSMVSRMVIDSNGDVGIGTEAPTEKLTVVGNFNVQDAEALTKSYRFRTSGSALDFEGGGANMYLSTWTNADFTGTQYTALILYNDQSRMDVMSAYTYFNPSTDSTSTIDVATPGTGLQNLIRFVQSGTVQGSITVNGATVAYNAFTGSHYAWTEAAIERGMLVSMTGDNRRRDASDFTSEPFYGITTTTQANDPKVLGSYFGRGEGNWTFDNPDQVMSVGNGDMWVNDEGGDIQPGDYLVSSSLTGHAMKDNGQFAESHIVARASDSVQWGNETKIVNGKKVKKISVLFTQFTRLNAAGLAMGLSNGGIVSNDLTFNGLVLFNNAVQFKSDTSFEGRIRVSSSTAGTVKIPAGQVSVAVNFNKVYGKPPKITTGVSEFVDVAVEDKTSNGFTLRIPASRVSDTYVDWTAFEAP